MWPRFLHKVFSKNIQTCFYEDAGMAPMAMYVLWNALLSTP
jgi:hypothetical protein